MHVHTIITTHTIFMPNNFFHDCTVLVDDDETVNSDSSNGRSNGKRSTSKTQFDGKYTCNSDYSIDCKEKVII